MNKKKGVYLGSGPVTQWLKEDIRRTLSARGNGHYWYDNQGFYFQGNAAKEAIFIPYKTIGEIRLREWQAGRWEMGKLVLEIGWEKDGFGLNSAFLVSRDEEEARKVKIELQNRAWKT